MLLVPVIACYLGLFIRLLIVVIGYYFYVHPVLPDRPSSAMQEDLPNQEVVMINSFL